MPVPGTHQRLLLAGGMWVGLALSLLLALPYLEGPLFAAGMNAAQGDFIARYAQLTQYMSVVHLAVSAAIVIAGLWLTTKLLPTYKRRVVLSVLSGSFLTAASLFAASSAWPGDEGYLRGFPLPWLTYTKGVGTLGVWVANVNFYIVIDILAWASVSCLLVFAATKIRARSSPV